MGSLSLLQWIFPTQESNDGLLNCSEILYQLSYQGSNGEKTITKLSEGNWLLIEKEVEIGLIFHIFYKNHNQKYQLLNVRSET